VEKSTAGYISSIVQSKLDELVTSGIRSQIQVLLNDAIEKDIPTVVKRTVQLYMDDRVSPIINDSLNITVRQQLDKLDTGERIDRAIQSQFRRLIAELNIGDLIRSTIYSRVSKYADSELGKYSSIIYEARQLVKSAVESELETMMRKLSGQRHELMNGETTAPWIDDTTGEPI